MFDFSSCSISSILLQDPITDVKLASFDPQKFFCKAQGKGSRRKSYIAVIIIIMINTSRLKSCAVEKTRATL